MLTVEIILEGQKKKENCLSFLQGLSEWHDVGRLKTDCLATKKHQTYDRPKICRSYSSERYANYRCDIILISLFFYYVIYFIFMEMFLLYRLNLFITSVSTDEMLYSLINVLSFHLYKSSSGNFGLAITRVPLLGYYP